MEKLITFIPRIAKAIAGTLVGAVVGSPAGQQVFTDNPVIWSWEYFLASTLGIGISVYLIPNKAKVQRHVIH